MSYTVGLNCDENSKDDENTQYNKYNIHMYIVYLGRQKLCIVLAIAA